MLSCQNEDESCRTGTMVERNKMVEMFPIANKIQTDKTAK